MVGLFEDGALALEEGVQRRSRSLRNRIRALERLLRWENLATGARAAKIQELESLQRLLHRRKRQSEKDAITRKYLPIRKREERKLCNELQRLLEERPEDVPDYDSKKAQLERDLEYVRHFPAGVKYVALFPKGGHSPRALKLIRRFRARIARQLGERVSSGAADIPDKSPEKLTEALEGPRHAFSAPHNVASSGMRKRSHAVGAVLPPDAVSSLRSDIRSRMHQRTNDLQRASRMEMSGDHEKLQDTVQARERQTLRSRSIDDHLPRVSGRRQAQRKADEKSSLEQPEPPTRRCEPRAVATLPRVSYTDPLLEPDTDSETRDSTRIYRQSGDDEDDALERHVFLARLRCPDDRPDRAATTRRSRGRGRILGSVEPGAYDSAAVPTGTV